MREEGINRLGTTVYYYYRFSTEINSYVTLEKYEFNTLFLEADTLFLLVGKNCLLVLYINYIASVIVNVGLINKV